MPPFLSPGRRRRAVLLAVPVLTLSTGLGVVSTVGSPAAASTATTSPCQPYQLPGLPGAGGGEVVSMNDAGVYAGGVRDASGGHHAAWWTHTGGDPSTGWTLHVPDIPAFPAEFLDVNASGVMSGYSGVLGMGFVYDSNTGDFDGINDQGTVAGYTFLGSPVHDVSQWAQNRQWRNVYAPVWQAFTRSDSGPVTKLPAGYDLAIGFAINNDGLVVGASLRHAVSATSWWVPAYWRNGVEHDMGAPADAGDGIAYNVSQGGWATGGIDLPDTIRSFAWTGAGTMQLNQPLPGYDGSWSHGVSDVLHQVAGSSGPFGNVTPTVWQCPADFTTG